MVHANAVLTPRGRLLLARLIVDDGWPIVRAAEHFHVSWPTAKRWATRYAEMGEDGMSDRSSRPHRSPNRTPQPVVRRIVGLRWRHRLSPLAIASKLSMPASTVHAVLIRCRLNRLSHIDIRTGEPIRRYEHDHPGSLIHVDVKKLGNIPAGGGWRFVGRAQGKKNRAATPGVNRNSHRNVLLGHAFVHTVIDDHSRVAYAEIHDDETAKTAIAVLRRAVGWFAMRGVTVERVLSDNGSCYKSHAWRDACAELQIKHKRTRPYRPQTNGKIERFHRTMANEWALRAALPQRTHTPLSPTELAAHLQSPPATLRNRQGLTHHTVDQPAWAVHLVPRVPGANVAAVQTWRDGRLTDRQAAQVARWLPDARVRRDLSWDLAATVVLEVDSALGRVVVKAADPACHHIGREITAFQGYTDCLARTGHAARLLHEDRTANVLVLSYLDGHLVQGSAVEFSVETYRQAGKLAREFHDQANRTDPDWDAAAVAKSLGWLAQPHRIEPQAVADMRDVLTAYRAEPVTVVPTHGDWHPRNWLSDAGTVKVIDFGRFAWRPAASDFCRLAAQQWQIDPGLADAFFDGYGVDLRSPDQWRMLTLHEAIGTAVWAYRVGDESFESQGHRMINEAMALF